MKVTCTQMYPPEIPQEKQEWAVSFSGISHGEFNTIMSWKEECAPNSFVGYATSKVALTMFFKDEKEYSLALLRWL